MNERVKKFCMTYGTSSKEQICKLLEFPEREDREKDLEKIFKEIIDEKFSNM